MNRAPHSLRLRLFLAAIVMIVIALAIAGIGLATLFERHVSRRTDQELALSLQRLAANVEAETTSLNSARQNEQPYGGVYWQISENDKVLRTSRSLWDQTIAIPNDGPLHGGKTHRFVADGPNRSKLIVMERQIILEPAEGAQRTLRLAVAVDEKVVTEARELFADDLVPALALLAFVLIAATGLQINIGLKPLEAIRKEVTAIRNGDRARLSDDFPAEVRPLSDEINALLGAQEAALAKARDRAADLAHGLKTPLTALSGDIRRLRASNQRALADDIEQAVDMMKRHLDREMTRARIRSTGPVRPVNLPLLAALTPLIETIRRTPAGDHIDWHIAIAPDLTAAIDRDDLNECMGNLLENAARHAASTVHLSACGSGNGVALTIEDDGPGIAQPELDTIQERGRRLDQSGAGAGLGFAIVRDVLDAYGGSLVLGQSALGGLQAVVNFPMQAAIPS